MIPRRPETDEERIERVTRPGSSQHSRADSQRPKARALREGAALEPHSVLSAQHDTKRYREAATAPEEAVSRDVLQIGLAHAADKIDGLVEQYEESRTATQKWYDEAHEKRQELRRLEEQYEVVRQDTLKQMARAEAAEDRATELQEQKETYERALKAIAANARSWHGVPDENDGHVRALGVIANWAENPDLVPEDVAYPASSLPSDYCNWGTVCRLPVGHEGPHEYPASSPTERSGNWALVVPVEQNQESRPE